MDAANPPPSDAAAATTATTATSPFLESEIASLFGLLLDDMLLHDSSQGTCCRNRCLSCAYLDLTSGDFACDEYTAAGGGADDPRPGGWLAPYVVADFGKASMHCRGGGSCSPERPMRPTRTGIRRWRPPPLPALGSWREIDSLC